jgi:hypothetical protein
LYLASIYLVANARLSNTDTPTLLVVVVVLSYRAAGSILRAGRTTPRQTAHDRLALSYQQRATQSCIQISRSTGAAAGAPKWTSEVANSTLANEASNNDQTAFGDNRAQVSGRPRAINMLRNGFLSVGAEPDNEARQK